MFNWLFGGALRERKLKDELKNSQEELRAAKQELASALDENNGLKLEIMALKGEKPKTGALYEDARPVSPEKPMMKTAAPVIQKTRQCQLSTGTKPTNREPKKHASAQNHYSNESDNLLTGVMVGAALSGIYNAEHQECNTDEQSNNCIQNNESFENCGSESDNV